MLTRKNCNKELNKHASLSPPARLLAMSFRTIFFTSLLELVNRNLLMLWGRHAHMAILFFMEWYGGAATATLGAGCQCGYPNICPGFVPCQNMSNQCLTYVLILSVPSIWLVFNHNTQLLSSIYPNLVLSANFYPVFVPKFSQIFVKINHKITGPNLDKYWTYLC